MFQFEILENSSNEEQFLNIELILIIFEVSKFEKSGKDFRDELLANAATVTSEVVETQEEVTCRPYLALENLCYIPAPKFCEEGDKVTVIMIKEDV